MKLIIFILIYLIIFCTSSLYIEFGSNISPKIQQRITYYLERGLPKPSKNILISFGNTPLTQKYIHPLELHQLGPEGYIIKSTSTYLNQTFWDLVIVCNGNSRNDSYHNYNVNIGANFASFQILEMLGFAFFHPLEPTFPSTPLDDNSIKTILHQNITSKPHFSHRGFHIHTM